MSFSHVGEEEPLKGERESRHRLIVYFPSVRSMEVGLNRLGAPYDRRVVRCVPGREKSLGKLTQVRGFDALVPERNKRSTEARGVRTLADTQDVVDGAVIQSLPCMRSSKRIVFP